MSPLGVLLSVISFAALVAAWQVDRRRRVFADLGTTPAAGVSAGRNEVVGRAWHSDPVASRLTQTPSVWWTFQLEEERHHTRTVTSTDANGNTTSRVERYEKWHVIDTADQRHTHLEVVDDSGSVLVGFAGATVRPRLNVHRILTEQPSGNFIERMFSMDNRTGRYRETEKLIAIGDALFVAGDATWAADSAVPVISGGSPFLISTEDEEHHRGRLGAGTVGLVVLALVTAGVAGNDFLDAPAGPILGVGLVVAILLVSTGVILFNRIRGLANQAARAWSLIEVQLQRRHDLIPLLSAAARGAAAHTEDLHTTIARARAAGARAARSGPDAGAVERATNEAAQQTVELQELLATVEQHPPLGTGELFSTLQRELADTESRIAGARSFYNDSVDLLNNRRQTFPGILVAGFADAATYELFDADGFARTVPDVARNFED